MNLSYYAKVHKDTYSEMSSMATLWHEDRDWRDIIRSQAMPRVEGKHQNLGGRHGTDSFSGAVALIHPVLKSQDN